MKENIKIALLAIIAGTLVFQTYTYIKNNVRPSNNSNIIVSTPKPELPKTSIKFSENTFDFGDINQDTENKHTFKFKNTGSNPLVIEDAAATCGCTLPMWSKYPIAPGKEGEISVVFKPGKQQGKQDKMITVVANTEPKETIVKIFANVKIPTN